MCPVGGVTLSVILTMTPPIRQISEPHLGLIGWNLIKNDFPISYMPDMEIQLPTDYYSAPI